MDERQFLKTDNKNRYAIQCTNFNVLSVTVGLQQLTFNITYVKKEKKKAMCVDGKKETTRVIFY
jgi:hypothetical protein